MHEPANPNGLRFLRAALFGVLISLAEHATGIGRSWWLEWLLGGLFVLVAVPWVLLPRAGEEQ